MASSLLLRLLPESSQLLRLPPRLRPAMLLLLIVILSPFSIAQSGSGPNVTTQEVDIDYQIEEASGFNDTSDDETTTVILDDVADIHPDVDYRIDNVKASVVGQEVSLKWDSVDAADEYVIYREYLSSDDEDENDLSASNMERNVRKVDTTSYSSASLKQAPCQRARYGISVVINKDYGSEVFWSNALTTELDRDAPFKATNLQYDTSNFKTFLDDDHHEFNDTEEIVITWDHGECIESYEVKMCMLHAGMKEFGFITKICDTEDVKVTDGDDEVMYSTQMEPCTIHWMEIKPNLREPEKDEDEEKEGSGDSGSGSGSGDFMGSGEIIGTVEVEGEDARDVIDSGYMIEANDVAKTDENEKGSGDGSDSEVSVEYVWTAGSEKEEFSTPGMTCPLRMSSAHLFVSSARGLALHLSAISLILIPFLV